MNDKNNQSNVGQNETKAIDVRSKFSNALNFSNYTDLKNFAADMIKSDVIDIDTPQEAIACMVVGEEIGINPVTALLLGKKLKPTAISAVIRGKRLGFDPITSIENIHYFKNKDGDELGTTGINIITASLLKAGVSFEVVQNFAPLYAYIDKEKNQYHPSEIDWDFFQVVNKNTKQEEIDPNKKAVVLTKAPVDYVTTIKFTRRYFHEGQEPLVTTHTESALYNDYAHLHGKFNWKTPEGRKNMLRIRCLSKGHRYIASDITNGLYSTEELMDEGFVPVEDVDYEEVTKGTNVDHTDDKPDK